MTDPFSEDEFRTFVAMLRRFCEHDIDQFAQVKITAGERTFFLHISQVPVGDGAEYSPWDRWIEPDVTLGA